MADHFAGLPQDVINIILDKVKHDRPRYFNAVPRTVCKSFLQHFRSSSTKATLLSPSACPALTDGTFSFCAQYASLEVLTISPTCFRTARLAGFGHVAWKRISLVQFDVWQEFNALRDGLFLMPARGHSLDSLRFVVGTDTCGPEVSTAIWEDITLFLQLIDQKTIELSVTDAPLYSLCDLPGSHVIEALKLNMVVEMFSIAQPLVFPNLRELTIIDKDSRFSLDGGAGLWQVIEDLSEDGEPFGPPVPKLEGLRRLTFRARHHDWTVNGELTVDTFRCIARQYPNLEYADLSGMIHLGALNSFWFNKIINCLCSLNKLQDLSLDIEPLSTKIVGTAELTSSASLVQKQSLKNLIIGGLTATQGSRLQAIKRPGLNLATW